jgi:hypothetical protein
MPAVGLLCDAHLWVAIWMRSAVASREPGLPLVRQPPASASLCCYTRRFRNSRIPSIAVIKVDP